MQCLKMKIQRPRWFIFIVKNHLLTENHDEGFFEIGVMGDFPLFLSLDEL